MGLFKWRSPPKLSDFPSTEKTDDRKNWISAKMLIENNLVMLENRSNSVQRLESCVRFLRSRLPNGKSGFSSFNYLIDRIEICMQHQEFGAVRFELNLLSAEIDRRLRIEARV